MKRIVILGGGTGGTLIANRLRRAYDEQAAEIVVVDHDDHHVYQPGLLFVPFGLTTMGRIARPRQRQLRPGIAFRQAGIDRVDVAAVVPLHGGASYVERSPGLGDELGFIPVNPRTLQATVKPNVFALGDATDVPASKAGSVAHFEGDVLAANIHQFLGGQPLTAAFDGHTNCFIETGFGRALLIDFNYDTEPLTGHYPARLRLPLLRESRLNHLGKLAFQQFYWHGLLPGRDIPGISSAMPARGKSRPQVRDAARAATSGRR